jgi:hypothetical protein
MEAIDAAWLAGLWDGEGHIGLNTQSRNPTDLAFILAMNMTCGVTMHRVSELLTQIGVRHSLVLRARKGKESFHKPLWQLRATRLPEALRLAEAILPYAVTKRQHWGLALEFCRLRVAGSYKPDGVSVRPRKHREPYGVREWQIHDEIRTLNHRPSPPLVGVAA